jgi:hypothetical protein
VEVTHKLSIEAATEKIYNHVKPLLRLKK